MLEALGLTAGEEAVYRFLIATPGTAADLVTALDRPAFQVETDLAALAGRGLVSRHGDRYAAAPPSVALGGLLTARREELRTAELAIVALAEQHRTAAADRAVGDLIEVVTGVEAVRQRFLQIQWAARERVRSFSTAPFVAVPPSDNTAEDRGVDRGVEYLVVVEREVLTAPGAVAGTVDSIRRGVRVRVADKLPIKLMMADSDLALVPLTTEPGGEPAAVLLHRSGLLAGVEALFEAVWQRSYPLRADALDGLGEEHEPEIGELDRKILGLLLSGLTDEAVAGQLDLSLRTLQRRLRALMDLAGVAHAGPARLARRPPRLGLTTTVLHHNRARWGTPIGSRCWEIIVIRRLSMSVTFKGNPITVAGTFPKPGDSAPAFRLVGADLAERTLEDFGQQTKVLNIFPSLDTGVCAASVRRFNEIAAGHPDVAVLCISADLPFAQKRFCGAESLENVTTLSLMRGREFLNDYGVSQESGPLAGLAARAVIVLDGDNQVIYSELVPEITQEPDYDGALDALK